MTNNEEIKDKNDILDPEIEKEKNKIFVTQDGHKILFGNIFDRLEVLRDREKGKPYEERTKKSKIFNRFSGGYFSPTFVKSFEQCPANSFLSSCFPRSVSETMNFGSCVHKVFERIVKEKVWTNKDICDKIIEEELINYEIKQKNNKALLRERYINNFLNMKDYLDESKPFPWDDVQMFPEMFYTDDISIFDVPLGSCYNLMDRVDIRDEGVFVLDYKTGITPYNEKKKAEFIERYLDQMICYSWMIHKKYGIKPRIFAYIPHDGSYIEFPINSLRSQSIFVEKVINYYKDIKTQREKGYFEERPNIWCKYCPIAGVCNAFSGLNNTGPISIDLNKLD